MKQIRLIVFLALCAFACQGIFGETYSGSCGENVTWSLDTSTGVLTISGTGKMNDYDYYGAPWNEQQTSVRTVIINKGVTSIGDYAFSGCSSLASITIPESLTSIGYQAFLDCSSLVSITIPEGLTSIGSYAFSGCSSLTSITIPEGVTSIGYEAFSGCSSLAAIIVASGNSIYDSRDNCNGIIDTATNTLVAGCKVTTIPESVTSIGGCAFKGCSLTSITIPEGLASIGESAFYGCSSLTSITIPEGVTSIGKSAFSGCSSLASITIQKNVRNIGLSAFSYCPSINSVTVCGSRPPICEGKIFDDAVYNNATLYVPVGTSTLFYVATGWMNFWTITETDTKVSATDMDEAVAPIYDLSGRRIDAADAVHGIYIQNGKKVYKR